MKPQKQQQVRDSVPCALEGRALFPLQYYRIVVGPPQRGLWVHNWVNPARQLKKPHLQEKDMPVAFSHVALPLQSLEHHEKKKEVLHGCQLRNPKKK